MDHPTYTPRHRDDSRTPIGELASAAFDHASLAVDPPPVHPITGVCVGAHRRPVLTDVYRMQSERGAASLAPLLTAVWMGAFMLALVGGFLHLVAAA